MLKVKGEQKEDVAGPGGPAGEERMVGVGSPSWESTLGVCMVVGGEVGILRCVGSWRGGFHSVWIRMLEGCG